MIQKLPVSHSSIIIVHVLSGNIVTNIILPTLAIVVPIAAVSQWYLEGRRVTVSSQSATLVSESEHRGGLMLSATNNGRIPALIRQWGFDNPREVYSATPTGNVWSLGPATPHTLEPGTSQVWWLDLAEQRNLLEMRHPDAEHVLRGFVVLGTRKRKVSRSLIAMRTGVTIPANPIQRRLARLKSSRVIGVMIFGGAGSKHFRMRLTNPKARFVFTKIRINVVQDPLGSRPARVLEDSSMVRRFWGRRTIKVTIPNYLVDFPGAWYRIRWITSNRPDEQRYKIPSRLELEQLWAFVSR
jgi:hypothetical protein